MSIKDRLDSIKCGFLISSLASIAIFAIPLYVIFLLGASYGSLIAINYFLKNFPVIGLSQFPIDNLNIILFSILLALILKPTNSKYSFDNQTEEWITSNLNVHFRMLNEISERLDRLEDINDYLININSTVDHLSDDKNA